MSSWWPSWLWGSEGPKKPMKPTDAAHDPALRQRFIILLDHTDPPATFKASEVAKLLTYEELRNLGYQTWQEAMPAVLELAFELRAFGDCDILKGGKLVGEDVMALEIEGGVRIRRREENEGLYG